MLENMLSNRGFSNLLTIAYFVVGGFLLWNHEFFSLTTLLLFLISLGFLLFIVEYTRFKKAESILEENIEDIVVEMRGGKHTAKKMFWLKFLCSLSLIFNGIVNSGLHDNFRIILITIGAYYVLIELLQLVISKNRMQIRAMLFENKFILYEMLSKETILMEDLKQFTIINGKISILSDYNQKITIDHRDFTKFEYDKFEDNLKVVVEYWKRKNGII